MVRTGFIAVACLVGACGGGGGGAAHVDAAPDLGVLHCPSPDGLPFDVPMPGWRSPASAAAAESQGRIKHQPADLFGSPGVGFAFSDRPGDTALEPAGSSERLHGLMARIELDRGYFGDAIADEGVTVWQRDEAGWQLLGETVTAGFDQAVAGVYELDLGAAPVEGVVARYAVLDGDGTCGAHHSVNLAAGRGVILTDIDGTLTIHDDELIMQVSDGSYDPIEITSASAVMQAWAAKGYTVIYMSARPHVFRSETHAWLAAHGFPAGPLLTATDLVTGDAARSYKAAWLTRLSAEFGWSFAALYGNAQSDIDAYADAGIDKAITFIVGELAGADGTVAIDGLDFTSHLASFVTPHAGAP
jgi:hypothetical protein